MFTRVMLLTGFFILIGIGIGIGVWQYNLQESSDYLMDDSALEHAEKHLDSNYVCPMHPSVVSDKPGSCPICGMDLEQKKTGSEKSPGVEVSAAMQRSLGVSTSKVEYGPVVEEVYASGYIKRITEAKSNVLNSTVLGVVSKVLYEQGDWVKKGAALFVIDSTEYEELLTIYLDAHKEQRVRDKNQALNKLVALGADRTNLVRLVYGHGHGQLSEHESLTLTAADSGQVEAIYVKEGDEIELESKLILVSSPKLHEVELSSYSQDAIRVIVGNAINLKVPAQPDKVWRGRVLAVGSMDIASEMNILGVFQLPEELAYVRMFVGAYVEVSDNNDVLRVPASAVIYSGNGARVVRKHEAGYFVVLPIETGRQTSDWVEVVSGLKEGGSVVTRGQFMIDSEASLRAGLERIAEGNDDN